jgi:flagellar assembly protein FliH
MNTDTPKEMMTAYQRWEMNSFGDERPSVVAKRPPPVELPTEADVLRIKEEAAAEGYEEGHAAGYEDGLKAGRAEAKKELDYLQAIAAEFGKAVADADETIAQDVMDLALQLAKGMLRNALEIKPELVIPVVREAIEYLPVLQQPALLIVNPADAELIRNGIGEELDKGGWRVVEDDQVSRGGCRIDTASNQIDATAEARWKRLTAALGKHLDWLG